ncbi:unnamed protein product [Rhizoctonia solani]|uniref:Uncharacterized protein n=1 Tax=Rhizoctonia solani TaxID=456999 RepID=A0A8H2WEZ1_9AGAM|nr:unnamed protein product [Rhizoctonia solani]
MSRHNQRAESPSLVIPGAGLIPSIFDLSSLPSDTPLRKSTGHGGDDLSLSDLSLANAQVSEGNEGSRSQWDDEEDDYELNPPLQLLNETPAPKRVMPEPEEQPEELEEFEEDDGDMTLSQLGKSSRRNESVLDEGEISIRTPPRNTRNMPESPPPSVYSRSRSAAEKREEQLHAALFQLRKINAVFGDYVSALEAVDANTERLERQVERTNAILDRYVRMLDQQEQTSKLVFDEEWRGGEADEQTVQERIVQQARLERERKEREERERREREEREREEAERALAEQEARERAAKASSTGRGRGTRGTATRGTARGRGTTGTTATGRGASSTSGTSSRIARPSSVSANRGAIPRTFLEKTKSLYNNTPGLPPDKIGPTVGQNMGQITLPSATMKFFDLGGQRDIRTIWSKYYDDCHAVIYMIDAADRDRLWDGWEVFETVLAHPQILDVPLLLLANKQDAPNSLSVNDVRSSYEAWWQSRRVETGEDTSNGVIVGDDHRGSSLDVMGVSALEGNGIRDAIDWVFIRVQTARPRGGD